MRSNDGAIPLHVLRSGPILRDMLNRSIALLVGVLLACGVTTANAEESRGSHAAPTYAELPVGAPTTLPWWQRGRLHVGGTVISTRNSDIVSRNGTTVVAPGEERRRDHRTTSWFLVEGKRLVRLPVRAPSGPPLLSANGRWLAWLEVRARETEDYWRIERYRTVIYDVERGRVATSFRDRRLVAWGDGINGIWLRTLSNRGRLVLLQGDDGVKVLSPRGRLARFDGPRSGYTSVDGWPRGTTVLRSGGVSVYGLVGRDGGFSRSGRFAVSFAGLWSADGRNYAYSDDSSEAPTYWVRPLDGRPVRLATPSDVPYLGVVGWESADAVILWHFDDYSNRPTSRLVRCSATTGACERVPGGPRPGAWATMPSRY